MSSALKTIIGSLLFLGLTLAGMLVFLEAFAPQPIQRQETGFQEYSSQEMRRSVGLENMDRLFAEVRSQGSRFAGQPGYYRVAEMIRAAYQKAGLETWSKHDSVVAPSTRSRRVLDSNGEEISGLNIYPFLPNHIQPIVTSAVPGKVKGELVLLTNESLVTRSSFEGCIGVLSTDNLPTAYGLSWVRFAQLGLSGLVVTNPNGIDAIDWEKIFTAGGMISGLPVNFARVAADAAILDHLGEVVELDVDTRFEDVPFETLFGYLKSARQNREVMVVPVNYDAYSLLNDLAPGTLQALPIALHLALVEGLSQYRDSLRRDVVFIGLGARFMGEYDESRLLESIGDAASRSASLANLQSRILEHQGRLEVLVEAREFVKGAVGSLRSSDDAETALAALSENAARLVQEQFTFVLNTKVFELQSSLLRAKVDLEVAGEGNKEALQAYLDRLKMSNEATADAAFRLPRFLETRGENVEAIDSVLEKLSHRLEELERFHLKNITSLETDLRLVRVLSEYENVIVFSPNLVAAKQQAEDVVPQVSTLVGDLFTMGVVDTVNFSPVLGNLASEIIRDRPLSSEIRFVRGDSVPSQLAVGWIGDTHSGVRRWSEFGYPAFALVQPDRSDSYRFQQLPVTLPWMLELNPLAGSLEFAGEVALSLAHGFGNFRSLVRPRPYMFSGTVLVSEVGASIVPNYPLPGAMVTHKFPVNGIKLLPGAFRVPILRTDPYGRYEWMNTPTPLFPLPISDYSPLAFWIGETGLVEVIKDEGTLGQKRYRSTGLSRLIRDHRNVNIVTFRASPVGLLDLINPQTLRLFQGTNLVRTQGLAVSGSNAMFSDDEAVVHFAPQDFRFFTTFLAGSLENELVRTVRAFILGEPDPANASKALNGLGFFPLDTPILEEIPGRTARSMFRVNQDRLEMQVRTGMADEPTVAFQEQSKRLLEESEEPGISRHARVLLERASTTYAMFVQPVLQDNIHAAIVSILWYLGLLVPFIVFFEKLLFGFSDIRKQLAVQAVTFLVVFGLLRLLHPAFELISSSLMILLGFVILIFSTGVMFLFSGKFKENLEGLKAKRGQVSAARINTVGVMGTAFALGLNNMHRRKVRTGLTCATLVLITFALICFTSIYSDFNDSEVAVGPASYQGFLVKRESFAPLSSAEIFALRMKYGHKFAVATREMWVGTRTMERDVFNPVFEATFTGADGVPRATQFSSALHLSPDEPLRDRVKFLTEPWWFPSPDQEESGRTFQNPPVILPDALADRLGIEPDSVENSEVIVQINGQTFSVAGIFDSEAFQSMQDLNGHSILPFDILALRNPRSAGTLILADDSDAKIPAEQVVLLADTVAVTASRGERRLVSAAIDLEGMPYREAREIVLGYLEQSGAPAFYGLEDLSYFGSRLRQSSFKGLIDMIIPLIIAAVTVLNTMRGSVYERKDEIYVYNAVGIAPRFVFFIFVAESLVYAVVGSMLGYLLSQGTGKILTILDLTGGLNMTFASMTSVYASLAVFGAVLLSSWIPARTAMKIAEPAEDSGWRLPEPENDEISFQLPFTFDRPDRVAVLILFERYLLDHGEGGSGSFSASEPEFGVAEDVDGSLMPRIECTVWLKPFDLAVSQKMVIDMPIDPESGEFIAKVRFQRLSGTTESWNRLNAGFVSQVRQQFLHWRAVSPGQREEFFHEAKDKLQAILNRQTGTATA